MPARTDHDRRDAQSAARNEIATYIHAYVRRLVSRAYAVIEEEATSDSGDPVDWITTGKAAAYLALDEYGVAIPDHARAIIRAALPASAPAAIDPPRP